MWSVPTVRNAPSVARTVPCGVWGLTIRLTPLFDACHVELFHHGFERLGTDAGTELQGYESGWHSRHLEALKTLAES